MTDHYWIVATGPSNAVYQSKTNTYVPTSDPDYVAWLDVNIQPPNAADEIDLWEIMGRTAPGHLADWLFDGQHFIQPAVDEYTKPQLRGYAGSKRYDVESGGAVEIASGAVMDTSRANRAMAVSVVPYLEANPTATIDWKTRSGEFVKMTPAEFTAANNAANVHVQQCFTTESQCVADIEAGAITTLEQIDDRFAALARK
jgi:hypothetical protein